MLTGLGHAAFASADLEKTLHFYCDLLGCERMFSLENDDGTLMLFYVKVADGQFLEFFPQSYVEPAPEQASFRHICLHTDQIHALVDSLKTAGVKIDIDVKRGKDGNLQAWVTDPDGNRIELMQLEPDGLQMQYQRK